MLLSHSFPISAHLIFTVQDECFSVTFVDTCIASILCLLIDRSSLSVYGLTVTARSSARVTCMVYYTATCKITSIIDLTSIYCFLENI